jgi:Ca2+-binding RTX toxin-like protein
MAITFFDVNTIVAGTPITWASDGDEVYVLPNVTVASTNSAVASLGIRNDIQFIIGGSVVSLAGNSSTGKDVVVTIQSGGSLIMATQIATTAALSMAGNDSSVAIDGTLSNQRGVGVAMTNGSLINSGLINAATGVMFGSAGTTGRVLSNSGRIQANDFDNVNQTTEYNNGVTVQAGDTRIENFATGIITTTATGGAGVRVTGAGTAVSILNQGDISAVRGVGIDLSFADSTGIVITNSGTISGQSNAIVGSTFSDVVNNSGVLFGSALLGGLADTFINSGRIVGDFSGGNDADTYTAIGGATVTGSILGDAGNDTLTGGDLADRLFGGGDIDVLNGGGGDDLIDGGTGNSTLRGGAGDDTIIGGTDGDLISGWDGHDEINVGTGIDTVRAGNGDDTINATATTSADYTEVVGGAGDDRVEGGSGILYVLCGAGDDTAFVNSASTNVFVALGGAGVDNLFGGNGSDTIDGGDDGDFLYGGGNNDSVRGQAGGDLIQGEAGADTLRGGDGDDEILGGLDNDSIFGDGGDDTLSGGDGIDQISGGLGADELSGGAGRDTLRGGDGNDTITGGVLADAMFGQLGADTFVFTATTEIGINAGNRDVIGDFVAGVDLIDLTLIDANSAIAGDQAFTFIGVAAFTNVAGQLRYSSVDGLLQGDANGNGVADFSLQLGNRPSLVGTDLLL